MGLYWQQQPLDTVQTTTIYKSTDTSGLAKFSDQPPENREETTTLLYRSDTNVIPSPSGQHSAWLPSTDKELMDSLGTINNPLIPYTQPQRVLQLIEDAKAVGPLLEKRQALIESKLK